MKVRSTKIIICTPPVDQLLPYIKLQCSEANCNSVFTNAGNLQMHLQKHHKLAPTKEDDKTANEEIKHFYCPASECIYNLSRASEGGKYFKCLKYLRQHYQKVHSPKQHECGQCGRAFATVGLLRSHELNECGRIFECGQCGWQYDKREALLLHERRKGHHATTTGKMQTVPKLPIPRLNTMREEEKETNQHQQTQTEETLPQKRLKVTSAQTETMFDFHNPTTHNYDPFPLTLCDIETQTESVGSAAAANANVLFDQMLAQSTHMCTQTCDDFLSELGLSDIQTQTNWSALNSDVESAATTSAATQFGANLVENNAASTSAVVLAAHDELLVSTETQTSFTQCLLDSCNGQEDGSAGAFNSLYNTQQTQTCETLLEGLFGAQESDLMSTFQSTYTQT